MRTTMQSMVRRFAGVTIASLALTAPMVGDDPPTTKPETRRPTKEGSPQSLLQAMQRRPNFPRAGNLPEAMANHLKLVDANFDKLLAHPDATDEHKNSAREVKVSAYFGAARLDKQAYGKSFNDLVAQVNKDFPKSEAAINGTGLQLFLKHCEAPKVDPKSTDELLAHARAFPKNPLAGTVVGNFAQRLSDAGHIKPATKLCEEGIKIFAGTAVEGKLKDQLESIALVGKPMEIAGPTLTGSNFDIKEFRGKVVLVDFWATWCGPCVGEIPTVKTVYEKYGKNGFEVVAISLDHDKADLEKFVKAEKLPWTQIFIEAANGNPLARKYKINSIPATFLLDREGRVIAKDLRGEALEPAVKKALQQGAKPLAN